jgi:hypothetical protein
MAIAKTGLSDAEKTALRQFCRESGVTEADLLRRMIQRILGDRIDNSGSKKPAPVIKEGSNKLTLRLNGSEIRKIERRAEEEGFSFRTTWAVSVLRQALSSVPILTSDEIKAIRESNRELAAIGRNLNQVAHAINIDPRNEDQITPDLFEELRTHLVRHREKVSALLDLSLNRWGVVDE